MILRLIDYMKITISDGMTLHQRYIRIIHGRWPDTVNKYCEASQVRLQEKLQSWLSDKPKNEYETSK